MKEQRRGQKIAMSNDELNEFLAEARTCRVATIGPDGAPHVTPLWFAWDGSVLWLTSIVKSQRWADVMRDGRVAIAVDEGTDFMELHGVEILGTASLVGEAPRTGEPEPELREPEQIFADKYAGGNVHYDGRHAWLKVTPSKIVSWDFRKIGQ
jgi:PPOX class probable F420-dependent enzyme